MPKKDVKKSMSGGGRDHFPTPQWAADFALQRVAEIHPTAPGWGSEKPLAGLSFLEPGCGDFAPFLRAAHSLGSEALVGVDLSPSIIDSAEQWGKPQDPRPPLPAGVYKEADFLNPAPSPLVGPQWWEEKFHIIATNPPYSFAEEFVRKSLELLDPWGIAVFLMRIGFAGSIKRMPLFRDRPPLEIGEFVRRFSFDGKGTDYTDYALFFWAGERLGRNQRQFGTRFYWVDNSKKDAVTAFGI